MPDNYLARKNVLEDVIAAHSQGGRVMVFTQVRLSVYISISTRVCVCVRACLPGRPRHGHHHHQSHTQTQQHQPIKPINPQHPQTKSEADEHTHTNTNTNHPPTHPQTKSEADELSTSSPYAAENTRVLHGDITQRQRELTLKQFRCVRARDGGLYIVYVFSADAG